ncbi:MULTISPECIES: efflux RND transporter periplasmic adaptor subunit [Bartonella]|uniref:efflux RND transporter periplasmic adaptor subunit n=1 Tax=Bartonella TaxID=773 RepID=UPI0018DB0801|nr:MULTISPECIES: efflux RND transporter periplasmic adaptor subunit [Bartonella]MBH9993932.1 efflux RND transporter periplasmic adaptor subunit [Bartonella sp. P0291]MBH9997723.1 efflux RND transporter periplasmic adaptor subunit [Bartonella sp. M0192]MBH9999882.1 efflux RND transporter periplasmic adaptor subunit [Bartonella sp. M0191]MBI0008124.1 efflux RND transporter periplasmic adaptor subunit [Bartonella sp. M0193]MBI0011174.1 efflux RND transporter periplasmic adaptor subunit [Bartonell
MKRPSKITIIVIIGLIIVGLFVWQGLKNGKNADHASSSSAKNNEVAVKPVSQKLINDRLSAIGTGRALATVAVTPWSSGVMDKLYVSAGMHVNVGDPVAKLDSDNEDIAVERAKVEVDDAELAMARTVKLRASNTATEVQELSAKLALDKARLALRDAELAADRRTIRAPVSGIVGILPVDAGNYVTSDTTIARIDNRDHILIDVWVPERFAPLIKIGQQVKATSIARPGEEFVGRISAIDNMIDEQSRTLRIRAEVDNASGVLQSGMSFSVSLAFPGDPYPAVDPLAIQWNAEGAYVWSVKNGVVEHVRVGIVQRNADSVLVTGALQKGDLVVTKGVQNLQDKSTVDILPDEGVKEAGKSASLGNQNNRSAQSGGNSGHHEKAAEGTPDEAQKTAGEPHEVKGYEKKAPEGANR